MSAGARLNVGLFLGDVARGTPAGLKREEEGIASLLDV